MGPAPAGSGPGLPQASPPRYWEVLVDTAVHAVAILAGLVGAVALLIVVSRNGDRWDVLVALLYCCGLLAMFGCSAAYNLGRWSRHGRWLRNLDQAAIFVMIASTYMPFIALRLEGAWSWILTGLIWLLAVCGILLRLLHGRLFDRVAVALYLALGWIGVVAIVPLLDALGLSTLGLLAAGGVLYSIGIIFHRWERLPFQNAIWHSFVVAATSLHYAAVVSSFSAA